MMFSLLYWSPPVDFENIKNLEKLGRAVVSSDYICKNDKELGCFASYRLISRLLESISFEICKE